MLFLPFVLLLTGARLDDFEDVSGWKSVPSDGVSLNLSQAEGVSGKALRLDFDFHGGAGYAVARKELPFTLPDNYEISFRLRGEAPVNNLEFKLVDPTGDNVWWVNRRNFQFPREWTQVRLKKRHIQFAWGPLGGGEIRNVAALELAITAGTGGKGYVLLDELTVKELPPARPYDRTPVVSSDGLSLDFLENREYGGLVIDWGKGPHASRYEVQVSDDGAEWKTVRTVEGSDGGKDYFFLSETESRHLRLRFLEGTGKPAIDVKPLEWAPTLDAFFAEIAKDSPRGSYPRWLTGEQSYWTVVGVPRDTPEGLFNVDGMLESGKGGFSVEPFLEQDGRIVTWNDVRSKQSLADGYLPIPTVTWESGMLVLEVTAFATGEPGASVLRARYRVFNRGAANARPRLFLVIRPFQVNPSWQFLGNPPGGVAPIREIAFDGSLTIDGKKVSTSVPPSAFGAATFDQGSIVEHLRNLPKRTRVSDPFGYASAALAWDLAVPGGESREVEVAIPLHETMAPGTLDDAVRAWKSELDRVEIRLPAAEELVRTYKSTLAYILINQDGPAIQPGSRSYERSWIRDGALTATSMLRLGHGEDARAFLAWYAPFQFENGKVPCCVDYRGADPVPENDSHGELLHLAAQVYRFTEDRELIEKIWPHVEKAVGYIEELRQQRRTDAYKNGPYFGLLPESISHEGYSDKPVHSYWDDFFALRGLKDAAWLAEALGKKNDWARIRDEFRTDLLASIRRTIALHKLDYLPASVEKGDFDPTSTSIGIAPGGELADLPQAELRRTFERYYQESIARRDGKREWDAYTPYELRTLRTFLRLGWRDRAHELLDFFMDDRRPAAWNHWAEVVWREPKIPKFIGDMPHTWVGSEFPHSFLDLFAYVREPDGALVLGDGLLPAWNDVTVRGLRTEYGPLEFSVTPAGEGVRYRISGPTVPPGGIIARWQGKEVVVRELPADVVIRP
ncbi:MAG TPA: discoidin domain-containing protein [Thermoanaerobaculia bacterium]|nr:discoidin domain-containing protein [Thermoanaerobaculia bacterium]